VVDIDREPVVLLRVGDQILSNRDRHLLHLPARSAHEMKVTMPISEVIRR